MKATKLTFDDAKIAKAQADADETRAMLTEPMTQPAETMQHTPGPWSAVTPPSSAGDYRWIEAGEHLSSFVAIIPATGRRAVEIYEALANARLIAAAPELLAALQALFEHCSMIHNTWGDGCNQKQADAAIAAGRDLLAKLNGGE